MKINFLFFSFLLFVMNTSDAQKQDYIWFMGKDKNITQEGIQGLRLDFNEGTIQPQIETNALSYDRNNAMLCDAEGNLLAYTNGCAVANRHHEVMENGDSLNWGIYHELWWMDEGDCRRGYPGRQDILMLPDPGYEDGIYIIHKPREFNFGTDFDTYMKYILCSYSDLSLNNERGELTIKNDTLYTGTPLWGYLSAIYHDNGKDWWIIQPEDTLNQYNRFLIDNEGIHHLEPQFIGPHFHFNTSASGESKFSPDGTKYALYSRDNGLFLYDFDRTTGILSNFKHLNDLEIDETFSGLEFSPSSELLYIVNGQYLYQVDLLEEDLSNGITLIDIYDGTPDPFYNGFMQAAMAPDCKIYIRWGSGNQSWHVINQPDERGIACDFVQRGLLFPQEFSTGAFPNVPRWRVDEQEKCDPSIMTMFGETVYYRRALSVYPNPIPPQADLQIDYPETTAQISNGKLIMYDMQGKVILQQSAGDTQLDLSHLPKGSYVVEYIPEYESGLERLLYNEVIVKQ